MREQRKIPVFNCAVTPLDICIEHWIDYHRRNDVDMDWHRASPLLVSDATPDSEQVYSRMDSKAGEAVDVIVNALPAHQSWAMKKTCGLTSLWRFPSLVFEDVVVDAKRELENKLKINVATRVFWY